MLEGIVDIYLPDIKYYSEELSSKYSKAPDYFLRASEAVKEMYRQTGENPFDKKGMLKKGVIIRHLVLPSCQSDSFKILDWIRSEIGEEACVSILNQYVPVYKASEFKEINRRLMSLEYTRVIAVSYTHLDVYKRQVYEALCDFADPAEDIFCSWGSDDIKSLYRNIRYHKLKASKIPDRYMNCLLYTSISVEKRLSM